MTPGIPLNRLLGIVPKLKKDLLVIGYVAHGHKWVWFYEPGHEYELLNPPAKWRLIQA